MLQPEDRFFTSGVCGAIGPSTQYTMFNVSNKKEGEIPTNPQVHRRIMGFSLRLAISSIWLIQGLYMVERDVYSLIDWNNSFNINEFFPLKIYAHMSNRFVIFIRQIIRHMTVMLNLCLKPRFMVHTNDRMVSTSLADRGGQTIQYHIYLRMW